MKRLKSLNRYQKCVLLVTAVMMLVFTVLYFVTTSRMGVRYMDAILTPSQNNGSTLYSGTIQGKPACFTVSADKTVEFQYGDQLYGPYTAREDPTAIPKETELAQAMVGIEVYCGAERIFRGGVARNGEYDFLYNEDGSIANLDFFVTTGGTVLDEHGNVADPMEPSVSTILRLMDGPTLLHKGEWGMWLGGMMVCIVTVIYVLFADEIFRLRLAFQIRNVDEVEPSEWEIAGRYITWTVVPIMALVCFIVGLQMIP